MQNFITMRQTVWSRERFCHPLRKYVHTTQTIHTDAHRMLHAHPIKRS